MNFQDFSNHPLLKQFVKTISASKFLFQQGQLGNTMFIIVEGTVELLAERNGEQHIFALVESGQFLGEKAIVKEAPYQRLFAAKAKTDLVVMELSLKDIAIVYHLLPDVMMDILKKMFQVAAERLERSNFLIRILRSSNNFERLVHCILYICRASGTRVAEGIQIPLSVDSLHYYIDMSREQIQACIGDLIAQRLILKKEDGVFVIPSENALVSYTPDQHILKAA